MEKRDRPPWAGFVQILENTQIGDNIFRLTLGQGMDWFLPGQFLTIRCGEETISPRPFSILSSGKHQTEIWFKVKGKGTGWLAQRKPTDSVYIVGPLGNHFALERGRKNLLLLAGGMGIVPMLAFVRRPFRPLTSSQITLVYGAKNWGELINGLDLPEGLDLYLVTENGTVGQQGLVTDFLPRFLKKTDQIFACGPKAMLAKVAEIIGPPGIPCQIALETVMGCGGLGRCFGCAVPVVSGGYFLLCQDGPVFDTREVMLNE